MQAAAAKGCRKGIAKTLTKANPKIKFLILFSTKIIAYNYKND